MKMIFTAKTTWICILLCTGLGLFGQKNAYGQSETGKFDFYLKANFGPLFNKNANETPFESKVAVCYGTHLTARYNFTRIGLSAGIGAESFSVSEGLKFAIVPGETLHSTLIMNYLALDIPVLAHYSFANRFDIYGGVNFIWVNWMSVGYGGSGPRHSILELHSDNDIPKWQFTQEVMVGLSYKLSERFDLGFNIAKSLRNIEGRTLDFAFIAPDQDDINVSEKFDYSWTRFNFELAYRLNK